MANWSIVAGQSWDERLGSWLREDCDALVVQRETLDPAAYVELWLKDSGHHGGPDYTRRYDTWLSWFEESGIEGVGFGWVNVRLGGGGDHQLLEWPYDVEQPIAPAIAGWASASEAARAVGPDSHLVLREDVLQETTGPVGAEDPSAIVIRPDMAKYVRVGREVRQAMQALTPLVEPLSIDEAFLDLSGTQRVHGMIPAKVLARFAREVERDIGITVSVGLSCNKFLAKIASDLDKPRGFAALDQEEARAMLADKPVGFIFGVGPATQERLSQRGYRTVADLQRADEIEMMKQFPTEGRRLWRLARGIDDRRVIADRGAKTISSETTFETDIRDFATLE